MMRYWQHMDAQHILKGIKEIAVIDMNNKDIVRHKLVTRIVEAYEKQEIKNDKNIN